MAERIKSPWRKIWTILASRFRKEREEDWVKERREVCKLCEFNSLNSKDFTTKQKVLKFLSDLYTKITFSHYIELGTCICGCSIYFLTREKDSVCTAKEEYGDDKWKSILPERNSKKKAR